MIHILQLLLPNILEIKMNISINKNQRKDTDMHRVLMPAPLSRYMRQ